MALRHDNINDGDTFILKKNLLAVVTSVSAGSLVTLDLPSSL